MKKIFIALLGLGLTTISAQQKKHTVAAKENLYAIAKKYNTTVEELLKQNPKIKDGKLNIGDVLIIPNKAKSITISKTEEKKSSKKLGKIYLQPKQTIYGITRQYKISEAELRRLNPDLDNHMKIGDAVTLPEENIQKYGNISAQTPVPISNKIEEKNTTDNGETYIIQPKDTYYGIGKKFNISKQELLLLNPELERKGLQPNDVIRIKRNSSNIASTPPKPQHSNIEEYVTHTVAKGDTAFGIANKYNISHEQLLKLNDELPNGLKEGAILKIKKYEKQYIKTEDNVFNIALMLPFGFDSNDRKYREIATDFLAGAKIAAQRNTAQGKKISINVIDAENEISFKNNLSQINKSNTDIIVGPFFKSNVIEVLNYVKNEKIPVVAPFAHTSELYDYHNLILVETNNRTYSERIAQEVKQVYTNQKIYIVGEQNDEEVTFLKDRLGKELKASVTITKSASQISIDQNMMTGKTAPAIIILASNDDNTAKGFAKKIIELGQQNNNIKSFSIYYHPDFEKNIDGLSQTNLVYLMDRKINTDGKFEKEVLADFKKQYCNTPSKYAIIGFDVVNDIITREYNGNILKQMDKTQTHLATKFEYIQAKKNGAFINTGYRVVRLIP